MKAEESETNDAIFSLLTDEVATSLDKLMLGKVNYYYKLLMQVSMVDFHNDFPTSILNMEHKVLKN